MYSAPVYDHILQCQPGSQPLMMHSEMPSWKPTAEMAPNCPRCASTNTKFCYYNNYSLSQPRYFCKGCRRYWTKEGSLRNVPVGGGCRKNRRSQSARLASLVDRTSIGHNRHNGSITSGNENPSEHNLREGINGSDIDMADVFVKFLNPNSSQSSIPNEINEGDSLCDNQSPNSSDFLGIESVELLEELVLDDHQESNEKESIHNIIRNDEYNEDLSIHEYGLQGLLDEEDVFWSDNTTSLTSSTAASFNWQELDTSFAFDNDHMKISTTTTNLCNDNNWGAIDFSSLGVFSGS